MNISNNVFIKKETIKRLIKDIKNVKENKLEENGIYYKHDEEDLLKGYILIIGPENTPYFGGYYFFQINYPPNYPFEPPQVIYHTNQEKIRFNPNLYTNGLVCVSILNTWDDGDPWSPCQNISTILLSILTLFTNAPLLNEPGITYNTMYFNFSQIYSNKLKTNDENDKQDNISIVDYYNLLIEYANLNIAICNIILKDKSIYKPYFELFYPIIVSHFTKNYNHFIQFCMKKILDFPLEQHMKMPRFYFFDISIDYIKLIEKINKCENICKKYTEQIEQ